MEHRLNYSCLKATPEDLQRPHKRSCIQTESTGIFLTGARLAFTLVLNGKEKKQSVVSKTNKKKQ